MNKSFIYASIIYVLLAAPALAEEAKPAPEAKKGPTINIKVDPKVSERNKAYDEAVKNLTPEQKATLEKFDKANVPAIDREIGVMKTAMEAKFCANKSGTAIAQDKPKYQAALGLYANKEQAAARAMMAKVAADRTAETSSFIDPKLAEEHANFSNNLMRTLAGEMMKLAEQSKGFEKTDCAAVQTKLDAALAEAGSEHAAEPSAADIAAQVAQLQAAADKGDPEAELTMAKLYLSGQGVEKDVAKGLALLQKGADKGYDRAQFMLGITLATDMAGAPDKEKAKYWLQKSAAQGNKKAEQMLGMIDKMPAPETPEQVKKKAEAGDAGAQYLLGTSYMSGLGKYEKKPEEGLKWLQLAAGQGHPLAQDDMGKYLLGIGKADEGIVWLTKAAQNGVTNAQYRLGLIYLEGKDTPKDLKQAAHWLGKAAEAGDTRAIQILNKK